MMGARQPGAPAGCARGSAASAVSGRAHQDRAVHLRRTGNHVLHVVGVTRAIHVRVVTVRRSRTTCAVLIVIPRAFSSGALSIEA